MNSGFQFCTGIVPYSAEGYSRSLFHASKHLTLKGGEITSFFITHPKRQVCCAEVHFHIDRARATSRMHAPFGSFLFDSRLSPEVLLDFMAFCESELRKAGSEELVLVHAPWHYYAEHYALLHPLLLQNGFCVLQAEVGSLLDIEAGGYAVSLHTWEQRRLRQAQAAGLRASCLPAGELPVVYDFLKDCRHHKGYGLSMSYQDIHQLNLNFPETIHLFAVHDKNRIAAAALCVVVNPQVLYAFYYDHHSDYDKVSPVVLLMQYVYQWCAERKFRYLDLGTSTTPEGDINLPLLSFKLRLGAKPSPKYTFQKILK